jgi:hypothetical protein
MNSIHTYNMFFFRVLILKINVIYFELSLVIVLKESKCMCMSYIIINHDDHGLKYMNTLMNL